MLPLTKQSAWADQSSVETKAEQVKPSFLRSFRFLLWTLKLQGIRLEVGQTSSALNSPILWKIWQVLVGLLMTLNIEREVIFLCFVSSTTTDVFLSIARSLAIYIWVSNTIKLNLSSKQISKVLFFLCCEGDLEKGRMTKLVEVKLLLTVLFILITYLSEYVLELLNFFPHTSVDHPEVNITISNNTLNNQRFDTFIFLCDITIGDFFMMPSLWLTLTLFAFSCVILSIRLKKFNYSVFCIDTSSVTVSKMREIRKIHSEFCEAINLLNNVFSTAVTLWYTLLMISAYFYVYLLIQEIYSAPELSLWSVVGPRIPLLSVSFLTFILLSEPASTVAREMHVLLPEIYRITESNYFPMDPELYSEVQLFVDKLCGPTIGLYGSDVFTITRSFSVSLIGTAVTFGVILMQINPDIKEKIGI